MVDIEVFKQVLIAITTAIASCLGVYLKIKGERNVTKKKLEENSILIEYRINSLEDRVSSNDSVLKEIKSSLNTINNSITRLSTIIEERKV